MTVPLEVIVSLFNHRHHEYKDKWSNVGEHESDFEERDELTERNDQEEHVKEELELIVQHLEQEGEHIVLLVVQPVRAKVCRQCRALNV